MLRIVFLVSFICGSLGQAPEEWNRQAQETLQNAIKLQALNTNVAKNVVFFLGDGMGVPTVTSARILKGQVAGNTGEETVLNMDALPHVALAKTYNTDQQVADSAGTATAFLSGVKTKAGVIGVHDGAFYGDCQSALNSTIDSILKIAQNEGKSTGIISTARITHATPACGYAHSPNRNWESNADIPGDQRPYGCKDIASQLIELGQDIKVVMGGGRRSFIPMTKSDPEYGIAGYRTDGRDLIDEWLALHPDNETSFYVWNQQQFDNVDPDNTEYLLGLFEYSHMKYEVDRVNDTAGEPSLEEMVEKAIRILQKNENGFLLLVEGGRIDHAHHASNAHRALFDTIAMDDAIGKALEMTSSEDTLTLVTADHSHTNTLGGYPSRGNPILGKYDSGNGADGLPYTSILYANGPGGAEVQRSYTTTGARPDVTSVNTEAESYIQQSVVPLSSETHGGEDVAIFADGPMAHLFHGVHEQHYIAHVILYAACLQNSAEPHCVPTATEPQEDTTDPALGAASSVSRDFGVFMVLTFLALGYVRAN